MTVGIHQHKAGRVPQLVAEVAIAIAAAEVEIDVAPERRVTRHREAQRIGAVGRDAVGKFLAGGFCDAVGLLRIHQADGALGNQRFEINAVDQVDRIERIAFRFRHFLAAGVAHQTVHVDGIERYFAGEVGGHHHHPCNPEEDDVEAGHQYRGRHEPFVVRRFFRPAERGKWHQRGREPGIEHVFVACQLACVTIGTRFCVSFFLGVGDVNLAVSACCVNLVPGRNLVAPPQLARDTPVLDIVEPLVVGVGPVFRHHLDFAIRDFFQRDFGNRLAGKVRAFRRGLAHRDEPLVGQHRLDHHAGTVAARHHQFVRLDGFQQALGVEVGDDLLAGGEAIHALIRNRTVFVDFCIQRQNADLVQIVALANLIIVEVVRRRDLHATGAEFLVDIFVDDNRDFTSAQWQHQHFADQVRVTLVSRIDRHCDVTQHGLGPRGGHRQVTGTVRQRIADVPHEAVFFFRYHLQIRHRSTQHRVPVHQPLAAINQALLEQAHEDIGHHFRTRLVHREVFALPVG